jgi:hypothetical protein
MNDEVRITLRIPSDLHDALVAAATADSRSLNGQIVHSLREEMAQRNLLMSVAKWRHRFKTTFKDICPA